MKGNNASIFLSRFCFVSLVVVSLSAWPSLTFAALSSVPNPSAPHKLFNPVISAENLPVVKEPVKGLSLEQVEEVRALFKNERFGALSVMMDKYLAAIKSNPADEFLIRDFLLVFSEPSPDCERLLFKWKGTFPYNYQPYLALAQYYHQRGWENRGSRSFQGTSNEHFQKMEDCFQQAEENIQKALKMKPDLLPAYGMLISIYGVSRPDREKELITARALALFPHSYLIRKEIVSSQTPRWGGSYEQMQAVARDAEPYNRINPNMTKLYGYIFEDQAWYLKRAQQYDKAVDLLRDALAFGERAALHEQIAEIYYYNLKDSPRALEEINEAVRLGLRASCYLLRSKIYYKLEDYANSLGDLETAIRADPFYDETGKWARGAGRDLMLQGQEKYKSRHVRAAIGLFNVSLKFNDRDYETFYWRGKAFFDKGDAGAALKDFEQALALNPGDFQSVSMISDIASSERQFDYSLGYWERFLKLEPKHTGAYLKRARVYYYKNDFENCLKDLNQSCRLGNREACTRINNVKTKGRF